MGSPNLCIIEGCGKKVFARGYCSAHYSRSRRNGSPEAGRVSPKSKQGLCSVSQCAAPISVGGMCGSHYRRMQAHGHPLAGKTARGAAVAFLEKAKAYHGDECLLWPYSHNSLGYGSVSVEGVTTYAHRIVCVEFNGEPESVDLEAAHSCGNGNRGCVTGNHLSWKTRLENQADRVDHGTHIFGERHGRSKITEAQVLEIRSMKGKMSQREIGLLFSLSQSHVSDIHRGEKWGWL